MHDHNHHAPQTQSLNRAFIAGIVLNTLFVIVELIAGFYSNSLALLSDAGHNLGDVASLGLSLIGFRLLRSRSNSRFTYGYKKATILIPVANAIILLIAVGSIGWEATRRLRHPQPTNGTTVMIVAAAGIVINSISALLFLKNQKHELNARAAYLHLVADALVSAGVVAAGAAIWLTGWQWLDPAISLVVMIIITVSSLSLLQQSVRLSLDAVPPHINLDKVKTAALSIPGIINIHHVHVWALSSTENALTAHLVLDDTLNEQQRDEAKDNFRHALAHMNIQHATLETEIVNCEEVTQQAHRH